MGKTGKGHNRMTEVEQEIRARLFALRDPEYKEFNSKLIPTVEPERVIGVRTPALRRLAKELARTPQAEEFCRRTPHYYYEENNLHGFLLESIRDYDAGLAAVEAFLPCVDNWATCDMCSGPRVFAKHLPELLEPIRRWLGSGQTYTVRYGIGMLMRYYLDGAFRPEYLDWVAAVRSEEYYVKMMAAWYFATALAKQYETALPYIEQRRMEPWTHNKAIQKAAESNRIAPEQKAYLKSLKVKQPGQRFS